MLTPDQKRLIAEAAAHETRLSWGRTSPRSLGDLVADVTLRVTAGSLATPTFAEYADALDRRAHAEQIASRDATYDALLENHPDLRSTFRRIAAELDADGVISFGQDDRRPPDLEQAPALGD